MSMGSHPIHQAKFLHTYAGWRRYLYGPEVIIHLLVRLLALSHKEILAREYIPIEMSMRILTKTWKYIFQNCGKSVEYHPKSVLVALLIGG